MAFFAVFVFWGGGGVQTRKRYGLRKKLLFGFVCNSVEVIIGNYDDKKKKNERNSREKLR